MTDRTLFGGCDDDGDVGTFDDPAIPGGEDARDPAVAAFVAALRAEGCRPAPEPRGALAELLAGPEGRPPAGAVPAVVLPLEGRSRRSQGRRIARTGAQVALGLGIAVASVGAAAAVDGVPAAVREPARTVVSIVTDVFDRSPDEAGTPDSTDGPDAPGAGQPEQGTSGSREATGGRLPDASSDTATDAVEKEPGVPAEPGDGNGRPEGDPRDGRPGALPTTPAAKPTPGEPAKPERPGEPGNGQPSGPPSSGERTPAPAPSDPPAGDGADVPPVKPAEKVPARP